jgi:F0F1-type ATP synthase assembly protein I
MQSVGRQLAVFTLGMVLFVLLAAGPSFAVAGWKGVEGLLYASLLCLIPGWMTVFVSDLLRHRESSAYIVLVGTGFRMVFVLAGMVVVNALRADLGFREFTVWLIVSYLVALALETWAVLAPAPAASRSSVVD